MATTAETYGFGARARYAEPRASEYDMKERVRLSGLFPRVRNEPMSNQLQKLLKEFEQNAALTGILERRRRQEERMQYELQGREGMRALEMNRTPALRAGMAPIATSARVAAAIAGLPPVPPDAADVMMGAPQAKAAQAAPLVPKAKAVIVDPKAKAKTVYKPPPEKAKSTTVSGAVDAHAYEMFGGPNPKIPGASTDVKALGGKAPQKAAVLLPRKAASSG